MARKGVSTVGTSGAFWFNLGKVMTQYTVDVDGVTRTLAGVEVDPFDPFEPIHTRRAIVQAIGESGFRSRLDTVLRTPGSSLDRRMSAHDFTDGRNAPITVADLLLRMGKDEILDAMVTRYELFSQLEAAA